MFDEPNFRKQMYDVTEVLLVESATATEGPVSHPVLDISMDDSNRPLMVIHLDGYLPIGFDALGGLCGTAREGTSLVPIVAAAQLFASMEETISKWSDVDRTRFHALVDQCRMGYRVADRRFREGK